MPQRERRPAGDRTALGNLDNTTKPASNTDLDHRQRAADAQLFEQLAYLRFRHAVERLHRLGPRPFHEMLVDLGASRLIRTEIEQQVERYAALDPDCRTPARRRWIPATAAALRRGAQRSTLSARSQNTARLRRWNAGCRRGQTGASTVEGFGGEPSTRPNDDLA
jgi:hypothetical protein